MRGYRKERMSHLLHRELSLLIDSKLRDPALGSFVSVTNLEISDDMHYVKVFVSFLDDSDIHKRLQLLKKASGFLKRELSKSLQLRHIPQIFFKEDKALRLLDTIQSIQNTLNK